MSQKYGGTLGEAATPFVLGGNPLMAAYRAAGGDAAGDVAVDAFVAEPGDWTEAELAAMLRELAIEIVTGG